MRFLLFLVTATALGSRPEIASAQEGQRPSEPRCWASLPVVDSIRQVFEVHAEEHRPWGTGKPAGLSTDYLTSVASAIAPHVRLPANVDARAFTVWIRRDPLPSLAARIMSAAVTYRSVPGGPVENVQPHGVGSSPAMERALAQAIISADSAGSIPPLPPGRYSRDLAIEISIGMRAQPEESLDILQLLVAHVGASKRIPVGHVSVERYRLDHGVVPTLGNERLLYRQTSRRGRDPAVARRVRGEDIVTMEFLVDDAGKAHADQAIVRSANHPEFVDAVTKALPLMRFTPARSGTCGLAVVVRQSFVFHPGN